jgi:hypothetical protein
MSPPVNALSPPVISDRLLAYEEFQADPALKTLMVYCDGATGVTQKNDRPPARVILIRALMSFKRSYEGDFKWLLLLTSPSTERSRR